MALARFGTWGSILWITVDHQLDLDLTKYITMSDLLDNSIIKGLWHVPQKLLLLDRLNVGALHLEELSVLIFFQFSTIS